LKLIETLQSEGIEAPAEQIEHIIEEAVSSLSYYVRIIKKEEVVKHPFKYFYKYLEELFCWFSSKLIEEFPKAVLKELKFCTSQSPVEEISERVGHIIGQLHKIDAVDAFPVGSGKAEENNY